MPPKIFIAFIVSAIVYLSACRPCWQQGRKTQCLTIGIGIEFIGYDSAELSTVYISQFAQGSNFAKALATDTYHIQACAAQTYTCCGIFCFMHDTAFLPYPEVTHSILPGYDYEVIIPSIRTVKVSNYYAKSEWACSADIAYYDNACPLIAQVDSIIYYPSEFIYISK